jgi:hypothetical protein
MPSNSLVLPRRPLLGLALAGLALPAAVHAQGLTPPAAGYRWRVTREGREIGTHRTEFTRSGTRLVVRSAVAIHVRVMGITALRITHNQEEEWEGDRLLRATGRQDRNGTVKEVAARAEGGAILVSGSAGELRLPAEAAPFAWWDRRRAGRPLFDGADGRRLALTWTRRTEPDGGLVLAVAGDTEGEAGFTADGTWRSLWIKGEDGSRVTYVAA